MQYRPEIDGLRAIAVLGVIFYHAKAPFVSGGYLGVDIFFVISGFLITTIIAAEIDAGTFTISNFYERRIRRIFPALWLVVLVCLPFAMLILTSDDLNDFFKSIAAVTIFVSNIFFYKELDYWSTDIDLIPLIHTWSLAVEEQFYIIFPVLLLLLATFKKQLTILLLVFIALISFVTTLMTIDNTPSLNFYSIHTRAWELLLGAIAAFLKLFYQAQLHRLFSTRLQDLLANIGFLLLLLSLSFFSPLFSHPGGITLVPTVGTTLVLLFATPHIWSYRILTVKPMILIGLISYSAYLWHQPVFAFFHHVSTSRSLVANSGLILLSLALAYFSWRFIEKPFRNKRFLQKTTIFKLALLSMVIMLFIAFVGFLKTDTSQERAMAKFDQEYQIESQRLRTNFGLDNKCNGLFQIPECMTSDKPTIAVWGDSYAMHIINGIQASMPKDSGLIQLTKSSCGPILGIAPIPPKRGNEWVTNCLVFNQSVLDWLQLNESVSHVVLGSPFSFYLQGNNRHKRSNGEEFYGNENDAFSALIETLDSIRGLGKEVVIFAPPPANEIDLGMCLAYSKARELDLSRCDFPISGITEGRQNVYNFLHRVEEAGYNVIWLHHMICNDIACMASKGDVWLYRDKGHLSIEGSHHLGIEFDFYGQIIGQPKIAKDTAATEN